MHPLAALVIEAHGGLDRWQRFGMLSADLEQGGALWAMKGHEGRLARTTLTIGLREQLASHAPFGAPNRRSRYTPQHVALQDDFDATQRALADPRSSFAGHDLQTPWSELQLAYFAGYAMWTYLNLPFLLAWPGVETAELDGYDAQGGRIRRLGIGFPPAIATHSTVQTLHVGENGLLLRHDYDVDITGGTPAAHLVSGYDVVSGIQIPTRRRIFPRDADGRPVTDLLVVSIDLSNIGFSSSEQTGDLPS